MEGLSSRYRDGQWASQVEAAAGLLMTSRQRGSRRSCGGLATRLTGAAHGAGAALSAQARAILGGAPSAALAHGPRLRGRAAILRRELWSQWPGFTAFMQPLRASDTQRKHKG